MRKTLLLLVILVLGGGSAFSQVLGRVASSYNNKWGIGVNAGTGYALGRIFYTENSSSQSLEVVPEEYRQAALNPTFSLDLWREGFTEPWFKGVLVSVGRGTTKYSATFEDYDTTILGMSTYWNIMGSFYVGYRISDNLNASLGITADISSPKALDLFANKYTLGLIAMVRYFVGESFYASARVQGGIPVFRNWGDYNSYWLGEGVHASEKKMSTLSLMLGIGFCF